MEHEGQSVFLSVIVDLYIGLTGLMGLQLDQEKCFAVVYRSLLKIELITAMLLLNCAVAVRQVQIYIVCDRFCSFKIIGERPAEIVAQLKTEPVAVFGKAEVPEVAF